jgi:hypothetical protein
MSQVRVNTIVDANSGNTAQINGMTPTAQSLQGFRNRIINGDMRVGQRGSVVFTGTNNLYGGADRWLTSISGTTVSAVVLIAQVGPPATSSYAMQIGNVATTGTTTVALQQRIEALNCRDLNSSSITITGKVLQVSGATQTLTLVVNKANAVDNFNGGVTQVASTTVSVANNTWVPFSWTIALGASDASNGIAFAMAYNSIAAQSNSQFFFTDIQLEAGSVATPFERRPYGTELALCQRYCRVWTSTAMGQAISNQLTNSGTLYFPTTMRSAPTLSGASFTVTAGSAGTPDFISITENSAWVYNASSNWTNGANVRLTATASSEL